MTLAIVFAFLAMIAWGVGDFLIQKTVKKIGNLEAMFWINIIAGLGLLPLVIKDIPLMLDPVNLWPIILITVTDFLFAYFLFRAYQQGKLSVVETVLLAEIPLTIILGLVFFHEYLSLTQLVFILLIVIGIFLISRPKPSRWVKFKNFFLGQGRVWEKGLGLSLVAVIFSAFYNLLTAVNARNISAFAAVWIPWVVVSIFLAVFISYKQGFKDLWERTLKFKGLVLATGIIDTAAWVFYALAVIRKDMAIVTAIVSGYAVIAMFLDVKFNKQSIGAWQYLGACLVVGGAVAISFFI